MNEYVPSEAVVVVTGFPELRIGDPEPSRSATGAPETRFPEPSFAVPPSDDEQLEEFGAFTVTVASADVYVVVVPESVDVPEAVATAFWFVRVGRMADPVGQV